MKKVSLSVLVVLVGGLAFANEGKALFLAQQASGEVQRLSQQLSAIQETQDSLSLRLGKVEQKASNQEEVKSLRAEVDALRAEVSQLRARQEQMREEIVKELSQRIGVLIKQNQPKAPPARPVEPAVEAAGEYTVVAGDTLTLISQAFQTTVRRLKEVNGLKSDNLRIGQKLIIPKN